MTSLRIAENMNSTVILNDGIVMPMFGLGIYRIESNCSHIIATALQQGYSLIDTAEFYKNEDCVGMGIQESSRNREEVFVISKWWPTNEGANGVMKSLDNCLKNLKSNYVDLYMIHVPKDGCCADVYRALMNAKKEGKIKSLGVANFGVHHLEALRRLGLEKPSVNQIQINPWYQNKDIVKYCRENDITVMGYSPMAKAKKIDDPVVTTIATKLSRTPAQILIRWSVQHGFITVHKTSQESRLRENADVFNWSIPDEDMAALNALGAEQWSCTWDPTKNTVEEAGLV